MKSPIGVHKNQFRGFLVPIMVFGLAGGAMVSSNIDLGSVAWAAGKGEGQGAGQGKGFGGARGGTGERPDMGGGKGVEEKIFRGGKDRITITEEEDSDRPPWAKTPGREGKPGSGGGKPVGAGTMKGDLYGDLYVILRDANGVPILDQYGHVQPIDADGNLIPLNEEGEPVDEAAAALLQEVDFSRLNVARSPSKVSDHAYDSVLETLNSATNITLDPAGRLVVTVDGVVKTIDSPLENLVLYEMLLDKGFLPGLTVDDAILGSLIFLKDAQLTTADLDAATSFLAAASDKATTVTIDSVVYLNAILGITGTIVVNGDSYVDYSTFNYDRASTYVGDITYLKDDGTGTGTYITVTEPIMTAVFGDETYTSDDGGVDGFAQATDDARTLIEFIHEPIH